MWARFMLTLFIPLIMVGLAIPVILQKVPPNHFYGFRTPYTLSSEAVWYRANRLSGIVLLMAGIFWIVLGLVLPAVLSPPDLAYRYVFWIGLGALALSIVASFWLVYRR